MYIYTANKLISLCDWSKTHRKFSKMNNYKLPQIWETTRHSSVLTSSCRTALNSAIFQHRSARKARWMGFMDRDRLWIGACVCFRQFDGEKCAAALKEWQVKLDQSERAIACDVRRMLIRGLVLIRCNDVSLVILTWSCKTLFGLILYFINFFIFIYVLSRHFQIFKTTVIITKINRNTYI